MDETDTAAPPPTLVALPEPRALSHGERAWLAYLVEPVALSELSLQADSAQVVSECSCGCPSIGLRAAGPDVSQADTQRLSATDRDDYFARSASVVNAHGQDVEITMHVGNGRLIELEVWASQNSDEVVTQLPAIPRRGQQGVNETPRDRPKS